MPAAKRARIKSDAPSEHNFHTLLAVQLLMIVLGFVETATIARSGVFTSVQ